MPPKAPSKRLAEEPEPAPEQIAGTLRAFLASNPKALVLEDGAVLFDLRDSKYTLTTAHGHCTLHLWNEDRNMVRRVAAASLRKGVLRLGTHRLGQLKPQTLEIVPDRNLRTPSSREAARLKYLRVLQRVLQRAFPDWKPDAFRTAMDLEKSFGPAYARGMLVRGTQAWAVIAVNEEESQGTIDGILTLGILWLRHCHEMAAGTRHVPGLKLVLPQGLATLTLSRLAWLNSDAAAWELWELDPRTEELTLSDPTDQGNLATHLIHAPDIAAARQRFASSATRIMSLVPPAMSDLVEQRIRSGTEMAFLLHGLEFARARLGYFANSFNRQIEVTFGAGSNETPLLENNQAELRDLVSHLFERRHATGDRRDPLFRMQPERWLESVLRRDVSLLDPHLDPRHVYSQVPAFAAADRGMLDLLSVHGDGRLAVIELKADEDLHTALQGLDYWIRVRWHHLQSSDPSTGLGEFQRHGYFPGLRLSPLPPRLYLAAPALRVHPATEVVLRYLSRRVEWTLLALDERWRKQVKVIWRKRSTGAT